MGSAAQLSASTVDVEPGHSSTLNLTVSNTGTVVDRFTFEPIGPATPWVTASPTEISLFPQNSETVTITFAPPRDPTVMAGAVPFAIKVVSAEDPSSTVVEEGTLNVGAFSNVTVELTPRMIRCRRAARTQLAILNESNQPYRAQLHASDPAAGLAFALNPATADAPPGGTVFARVGVRPKRTFWRGPAVTKPYSINLTNQDLIAPALPHPGPDSIPAAIAGGPPPWMPAPGAHPAELVVDGVLTQEALLPEWFWKAVAAVLAVIIVAVVLWFALVKPQIKAAAQNQVNKQLAAAGIAPAASGAGSTPKSGGGGTGGGGVGSPSAGGSTATVSTGGASGLTVNGTSQATADGTNTVYSVPGNKSLQITDLLVENSAGSSGTIELARSSGGSTTVLMQWALANFRDLDYHWIAPTVFGPGTTMQFIVTGCSSPCSPAMYYAGTLVQSG